MLADLKERRFSVQRKNTVFWHVWAFFFLENSNLVLLRLIFFYFDLEARFRALRVTLGAEWSIIDLRSGVKWQSIQSRIYSAKSRHFARTNEKDTSHRLSDGFGFHMLTYIEENFFFQQIIFLFRDIALVRGLFTHWESKVSSWICSVVSKPRGSRISAFLVSDNFFLTFLLLLARSEDRELLACLLCMISSTWNLPGFGGTSISLNWKQSKVRSPNFWVTECSVFQKKGDRRKEHGSALPRLHGTDFSWDLLDLTFCEKTKEK